MRDLRASFGSSPGSVRLPLVAALAAAVLLLLGPATHAQDRPRHGGELIFLVPSEPPTYDAHREGAFGTVWSP